MVLLPLGDVAVPVQRRVLVLVRRRTVVVIGMIVAGVPVHVQRRSRDR